MAVSTPRRNSSMRSGRMAMPRSPRAQSPAGRLNSTCARPFFFSRAATTSGGWSYGPIYSTPLKPARAAASKRSRNSCSPKSIERLAEKRGMLLLLVQQRDRGRRIFVVFGKLLEFDDVVDLRAHRDVGDPFEDELDDDRHLELFGQPLGFL